MKIEENFQFALKKIVEFFGEKKKKKKKKPPKIPIDNLFPH